MLNDPLCFAKLYKYYCANTKITSLYANPNMTFKHELFLSQNRINITTFINKKPHNF